MQGGTGNAYYKTGTKVAVFGEKRLAGGVGWGACEPYLQTPRCSSELNLPVQKRGWEGFRRDFRGSPHIYTSERRLQHTDHLEIRIMGGFLLDFCCPGLAQFPSHHQS